MTFNPNEHLIQLPQGKGKFSDYLPVQWRLVWFREDHPNGTIVTEAKEYEPEVEVSAVKTKWDHGQPHEVTVTAKGRAVFRAIVTTETGGVATATKMETAVNFPDYAEKAETGSIGRALAMLGYGTQFTDELEEGERIVDAPVTKVPSPESRNGHIKPPSDGQLKTLTETLHVPANIIELLDFTRTDDGSQWGTSPGKRVMDQLFKERNKDRNAYDKSPGTRIEQALKSEGISLPSMYASDPD